MLIVMLMFMHICTHNPTFPGSLILLNWIRVWISQFILCTCAHQEISWNAWTRTSCYWKWPEVESLWWAHCIVGIPSTALAVEWRLFWAELSCKPYQSRNILNLLLKKRYFGWTAVPPGRNLITSSFGHITTGVYASRKYKDGVGQQDSQLFLEFKVHDFYLLF